MSNGTAKTIFHLGYGDEFEDMCKHTLAKVRPFIDGMVNYFETKNYIFVHSWIPVINKDGLPAHYTRNRDFDFNPNWREANQEEWDAAMWGNPFDMAAQGLNKTGKTIVFGHWHTSWPRSKYEGRPEFDNGADFSVYYGDEYIAMDACCAHSGRLNCLVIEDDFIDEK
jgi:hypothetical protein